MSVNKIMAAVIAAALFAAPGRAADPKPILEFDFENDADGWTSFDPSSTPSRVTAKDDVKRGKGALEYSYELKQGAIPLLVTTNISVADSKSVRFWAKASAPTALGVALTESDQSNYFAACFLPKGEWREVALSLADFTLANDSTDENDQLDIGEVATLGFIDVGAIFVQFGALDTAQRSFLLDDVQFLPTAPSLQRGLTKTDRGPAYVVDNFDGPTIYCYPIEVKLNPFKINLEPNVKFELAEGAAQTAKTAADPGGKGLKISYKRADGMIFALIHGLEKVDLRKATKISLWMKSSKRGLYVMQLKEKDDSEYVYNITYEPGDWQQIEVDISDFKLGDNGKDENNQIDLDQLKECNLIDGSLFLGEAAGDVTLQLDAIVVQLKQ